MAALRSSRAESGMIILYDLLYWQSRQIFLVMLIQQLSDLLVIEHCFWQVLCWMSVISNKRFLAVFCGSHCVDIEHCDHNHGQQNDILISVSWGHLSLRVVSPPSVWNTAHSVVAHDHGFPQKFWVERCFGPSWWKIKGFLHSLYSPLTTSMASRQK